MTPRRRTALLVVLLAGAALAAVSLAGGVRQLGSALGALSVGGVALAAAAAVGSLLLSMLTWRSVLQGMGQPLPVRTAARVYFLGQLGKYVPGSVWSVLAHMELGAARGLSRSTVGTASLLALVVGVPGALLLGLLAVPALLRADSGSYAWVLLAAPLALVLLWPPVLAALVRTAFRLLRREPPPGRLDGAATARSAALSGAGVLLLGLQAAVLAVDLGASGWQVVPLAVGAFALANLAGLLAVPLPAGAGVREAVVVLAMSPVLDVPEALALALASRLVLTAGDLATAALPALLGRPSPRP